MNYKAISELKRAHKTPYFISRIPASRVHEIINEKRGISVDTALRLAKFFETDLNLWVNLQAQYEADSMDAQKCTEMERIVPYSELQRASAAL